jgi:hypothetical protein
LIIMKDDPPGSVAVLGQDVGSKGGIVFAVALPFLVEDIGPVGEAAAVCRVGNLIQQESAELLGGIQVLDGFGKAGGGGGR